MKIPVHHDSAHLLDTRLGPDGDWIWTHGIRHGDGRDLLNLFFEMLHGRHGNEPIQKREKRRDRKLFLLCDQIALAEDPHQLSRSIHHGDAIDAFFEKEPCGMSDIHLRRDGDHISCHDIFYTEHGTTLVRGELENGRRSEFTVLR